VLEQARPYRVHVVALLALGLLAAPLGLLAAVVFIGARHVQAGTLTLGELLLVVTCLVQVYGPLETIGKKVGDLQAALASAERAFAVLDEGLEVARPPGPAAGPGGRDGRVPGH